MAGLVKTLKIRKEVMTPRERRKNASHQPPEMNVNVKVHTKG